jgi:hypothetical protein
MEKSYSDSALPQLRGKEGAVGEAIFVQGLDQVLPCLLLLLCIPFFHPGPEKLHQLAARIPGRQVLVKKAESQGIRRQALPLGLMLKPIFKIRWKAQGQSQNSSRLTFFLRKGGPGARAQHAKVT